MVRSLRLIDGMASKKDESLLNRHGKDIADGFAFIVHLQRFAIVTLALAILAVYMHVWQEIHFNEPHPRTLAGLATPTLSR